MKTIVTKIGQEWQKCPFEWGLEDYIVIEADRGLTLILMDIFQHTVIVKGCNGFPEPPEITYKPAKVSELRTMEPTSE